MKTITFVNRTLPRFCTTPVKVRVLPGGVCALGHIFVTRIPGVLVMLHVAVTEFEMAVPQTVVARAVSVSVTLHTFVGAG